MLIDLFIRELRRSDAIEKKKTSDGFPRDKYKHMACYEEFIKSMGITFNFRIKKESKKLEYRDLTEPEKLKLFQNIPTYACPSLQSKQRHTSDLG